MNCCAECFQDQQIQTMISANGKVGTCDFCGKAEVPICSVEEFSDLSDLISDVLSSYEEDVDGEPLFSTIINDWGIFKKDIPSSRALIAAFCSAIYDFLPGKGDEVIKVALFPYRAEEEHEDYVRPLFQGICVR